MRPLHLSTFVFSKSERLLDHLGSLSAKYGGQGHTILFALSSNFQPVEGLGKAVDRLVNFNKHQSPAGDTGSDGRVVGCLSDSLGQIKQFQGLGETPDAVSCSIAVLDSEHCVPFYSPLPGRQKPQVGRWHSFRKNTDTEDSEAAGVEKIEAASGPSGQVNWEEVWNRSSSKKDLLPPALTSINPTDVHSLIHMSVLHPDLFLDGLSTTLPSTTTLGLYASPTHFITGRPVTLFLNDRIYGEGSVGIALLQNKDQTNVAPAARAEFLGARKISERMIVTSVEGNMVNSLNDTNPTQLLLRAIQAKGVASSGSQPLTSRTFKEDEDFALGLVSATGDISQAYKITAGDPAHRGGSISLDATQAPPAGSTVQFLQHPAASKFELPTFFVKEPNYEGRKVNQKIAFVTTTESTPFASEIGADKALDSHSFLLEDTFLAGSHLGFVLHPGSRTQSLSKSPSEAWSSSLKGGMGLLEWDTEK